MGDYEQVDIPADDVPDAPAAPKKPSAISSKASPASKPSPKSKQSPKSKSNPSSNKKAPVAGAPLRDDDINLNSSSVAPGTTSNSQLQSQSKKGPSQESQSKKTGQSGKDAKHPKIGGFFQTKFPKSAYAPSIVCAVTLVMTLVFAFNTLA